MYIAKIPNRSSPPAILLREGYREGGKVKTRTLANLTHWPEHQIEALRKLLRGETLIAPDEAFDIERSLPHGHVAAVLGSLRRLGLEPIVARKRTRLRDLAVAMIVARIIDPCSKLATARGLGEETAFASLGELLSVDTADENELYQAMDWLVAQQPRIEDKLARRHLHEGTLALYDVSSAYFEGRHCPLGRLGYSREGQRGKLQIVFGLLCNGEGCPVSVEVFEGNTADPKTLASQIEKVRQRFELKRVVFVGDRGMITTARIREELKNQQGLEWVTALRAPEVRKLVERGSLQLTLFDEKDLAEILDPAYPSERLIVCRNPLLAEERARKRAELLEATEQQLQKIMDATTRKKNRLKGRDKIGLRVGRVLGRFKVGKHFRLHITEESFHFERDQEKIDREAALDGLYVIRTSMSTEDLSSEEVVRCYKQLSTVEQAFRSFKGVDLRVRPIHHRLAERVRAHLLICMLAYHVEWHMKKDLAPLLFVDNDKAAAEALRPSVVAPARRSPKAQRKAQSKKTEQGLPVHSFQTLLKDLATLTKNRVRPKMSNGAIFELYASPTPVQQKAFDLLGVSFRM